ERWEARLQVAREIPQERDHALARIGLRATTRARVASANAAAKLGREAPPHGSACGCVCAAIDVHQSGPTGASRWQRQKPASSAPAVDTAATPPTRSRCGTRGRRFCRLTAPE